MEGFTGPVWTTGKRSYALEPLDKTGHMGKILAALVERDIVDETTLMLDSTTIKAHQHGASKRGRRGLGRSWGGLTAKAHAVTDGLGNPLHFTISSGNP